MNPVDRPDLPDLVQRRDWVSSHPPGEPLKARLHRARSLFKSGGYREAIDALTGLGLSTDHGGIRASVLALRARALLRLGREDEARAISRDVVAALEIQPDVRTVDRTSAEELSDLGIALYLAGGRDADAGDRLQRAIDGGIADAETYRYLGFTHLRLESFAVASEALMESLQLEAGHLATLDALIHCLEQQRAPAELVAAAYLDKAGALFESGRLSEAFEACSRSVALADSSRGEAGLGIIQFAQGQLEPAVVAFDRALALDPDSTDVRFRKGEVLRLLGRFDEAIATLKQISATAPEFMLAQGSLGVALAATGHPDEALVALDLALAQDPNYAFGLASKGNVLVDLNRPADAIVAFRQAVSADPSNTTVWFRLAELLRLSGRLEEAIDVVNELLQRAPDFVMALGTKGRALVDLRKPAEAIAVLDRAIELQSDYVFGLLAKADALLQLDRRLEAIDIYRKLLQIDPTSEPLALDFVKLRGLDGNLEESLSVLDDLLARQPNHAEAIGIKGQVLAASQRPLEAVGLLQRATELDPSLDWVWFSLGDTRRQLGQYEAALAAFDRALEQTPDDVETLAWKGDVLLTLGRYPEALDVLERALARNHDDVFALGTKAQVLAAQGQRQQAVELLMRAVELDATLPWTRFELSENLRLVGRYDEAVAHYDEMLKLQPERVDALSGKANALEILERYEEALRVIDQALELDPTYGFGLATKGALLADCGEFEAARECYLRATADETAPSWELIGAGFVLRILGRYAEAQQVLQRAVELDPDDLTARHILADAYTSGGQPDRAKPIYELIINRSSEMDPDTMAIVGWCYVGLGDYDRAVESLVKAVSRGRLMAHAQFDLALALLCSERGELAKREYERGIELAIAEHHAWRRRGLCTVALADVRRARVLHPDVFTANSHADVVENRLQQELDSTPGPTTGGAGKLQA